MPLQATSGAASYDAFGGGVPVVPAYIEEVFSCFLYTGNSSTQTINNGIDLSTKGGLVWIKGRGQLSGGTNVDNILFDSARGASKILYSNLTDAESTTSWSTAFNNNGFSFNTASGYVNSSSLTVGYTSWTFRKQPKFFDVVTFSTTNSANARIPHNLGSVPACYIIKRLDGAGNWFTYHTSLGRSAYLSLNATNASASATDCWGTSDPTTTDFGVNEQFFTNGTVGLSYVAYLFAHNAGGFGLTGTDNVISCGRLTANGSATTVDLGFEPQWILTKDLASGFNWNQYDNMSGFFVSGSNYLRANTSEAQGTDNTYYPYPTSTGFGVTSGFTNDMIYIAIRRGPMKVPTSGTSVFAPIARTGTSADATVTSVGFPVDLLMSTSRQGYDAESWWDRLRNSGGAGRLLPSSTSAEIAGSTDSLTGLDVMDGFRVGADTNGRINYSPWTYVYHCFRRAPSFFDEVCYTGTGSARTLTHNLGVVPELMIIKSRSDAKNWGVYVAALGNGSFLNLNTDSASGSTTTLWNSTSPTSSVFTVGTALTTNESAITYAAYLFATCAGVSKCFNYTGNGSSQTINCGFTGGARWILIKRTDSTGDWYCWDSARGIVSGNDPHLSLNTTAAEVTSDDTIDTDSTGFVVNQVSATNVNVSSATYIGIAIA